MDRAHTLDMTLGVLRLGFKVGVRGRFSLKQGLGSGGLVGIGLR